MTKVSSAIQVLFMSNSFNQRVIIVSMTLAEKETKQNTNMKHNKLASALLAIGLAGFAVSPATAADKIKPSSEVETKITETLKATFPEVVIASMAQETEDGLTFFAVDMTSKGERIDADVTADGTLVGTEQAADMKTFPKAARKTLEKATKGMKVVVTEIAATYAEADKTDPTGTKAVKLAKPTVAYDADVEQDGQSGEFAASANGTILESPKWVKAASTEKKEAGKEDKD